MNDYCGYKNGVTGWRKKSSMLMFYCQISLISKTLATLSGKYILKSYCSCLAMTFSWLAIVWAQCFWQSTCMNRHCICQSGGSC